jgi:hypothetical protein
MGLLKNRLIDYVFEWMVRRKSDVSKGISGPFMVESANAGSPLTPGGNVPKYQGIVYNATGTIVGGFVRLRQYAVLPEHVFLAAAKFASFKGSLDNSFEPIAIATDLVAVCLTADEWSRLGLAKPSVMKELAFTKVTDPDGLHAYGAAELSKLYGGIDFNGSTMPGCSGCAYDVGGRLLGVHVGGQGPNKPNFGYSASFIEAWLVEYESPVEEVERQGSADYAGLAAPIEQDFVVNGRHFNMKRAGNDYSAATKKEKFEDAERKYLAKELAKPGPIAERPWADEMDEIYELMLESAEANQTLIMNVTKNWLAASETNNQPKPSIPAPSVEQTGSESSTESVPSVIPEGRSPLTGGLSKSARRRQKLRKLVLDSQLMADQLNSKV